MTIKLYGNHNLLKIIHTVFLTLLLLLYTSLPNAAEILEGRVIGVHDGSGACN